MRCPRCSQSTAHKHPTQVRIKKSSISLAGKISNDDPPPADAEAYFAPRRTIRHYTDEVFAWEARLRAHGDLEHCNRSKVYTD